MEYIVELNHTKYVIDLSDTTAKLVSCLENSAIKEEVCNDVETIDIPDLDFDMEEKKEDLIYITASMPGTIISILVKEGDCVKKGDTLLVFESMKMENDVIAGCSGKIDEIFVQKGNNVEFGRKLLAIKSM
jgi:biotin carboxyl carrier protein